MLYVSFKIYTIFVLWRHVAGHPNNLAWVGGSIHLECDHSAELLINSGQYVRDNIIATKAVTYNDQIYVITPRFKRGVPASVWLLVRGRHGPEMQAFPSLQQHTIGECHSIQNAIDVHLDHLSNLWVLDSGSVDTLEAPRCTCPAKVVVVSIILDKVTKNIDLSSLTQPGSLLQNIVVEYELGAKPFIYISDASRGAIIVHDVTSGSEWSVLACSPAAGLQLALVKRAPTNSILILNRLHQQGLLELDTASLKRKKNPGLLREHSKRITLLGFDSHHVYLRHTECTDVLLWNTKELYNASNLLSIHSPGPRLMPTSVTSDPHSLKRTLIVLDTNYIDTLHTSLPTFHRITYIGQI